MKKFSLFILALLCLCANAWALDLSRYSSAPTSGETFYIYNVGQKCFLRAETNKFDYTSPSVSWTITSANDEDKYYIVGNSKYIYLKKDGTSYSVEMSSSKQTVRIQSSDKTSDAYKIYRTSDTKYLNFDNNNLTPANNSGVMNDWIFMTSDQYEDYLADLHAEVIANNAEYLPSTSGWNRIVTMPSSVQDYYYCFVSDNQQTNLMLSLQDAANNKNGNGRKAFFYTTSIDPLTNNAYLWSLRATGSANYFTIQNKSLKDKYMYSPDGNEYLCYAETYNDANASHYGFEIVYSNGSWSITNSDYFSGENVDAKHIGLWSPETGYWNGQELAANKQPYDAGHFQIYALKKDAAFINPNFQASTWNDGWTVTGFGSQTNDQFGTNNVYTEMYVPSGEFGTLGDIHQTLRLPAGSYKLKADIVSRNIESELYASDGTNTYSLAYTGEKAFGKYIVFTLTEEKNVNLGYRMKTTTPINTSTNAWVGVDNFVFSSLSTEEVVEMNRAAMTEYVSAVNTLNNNSYPTAVSATAPVTNNTYLTEGDWLNNANNYSIVNTLTSDLNTWLTENKSIIAPYLYALAQADIAERSDYDAASDRTAINNATTVEGVNNALNTLRTNAISHISSNKTAGMDMSIYMVNPTIIQQSTIQAMPSGWTAYAHESGNGNYSKELASDSDPAKDTYLEYYNTTSASFNVDYYQAVTLPAGTYRLSAKIFFNGNDGAVALYAYYDNQSFLSPVKGGDGGVFNDYSLDFALSAEKTVNLGVKVVSTPASGSWMGADNFSLTYISDGTGIDVSGANNSENWGWCNNNANGWRAMQSYDNYAGYQMVQCYNDNSQTKGDVMTYTLTELTPGFYTANVGFNVHCSNWDGVTVVEGAEGTKNIAVLKLNNQYCTSALVKNTGAATACHIEEVKYIQVQADGNLVLTVSTQANGANWLTVRLNSLTYLGSGSYTLKVGSIGWASLCLPFATEIPEGVTAYYARVVDAEKVTLSPVRNESIAANEPVIIQAEPGEYTFNITNSSPSAIAENLFSGTTAYKNDFATNSVYVLSSSNGNPCFAPLIKQSGDALAFDYAFLGAYKAYLPIPQGNNAASRISFVISEENTATSVQNIKGADSVQKIVRDGQLLIIRGSEIYDVTGRRIQ